MVRGRRRSAASRPGMASGRAMGVVLQPRIDRAQEQEFQQLLDFLSGWIASRLGGPADQVEGFLLLGEPIIMDELKLAFYANALGYGDNRDSAAGFPCPTHADLPSADDASDAADAIIAVLPRTPNDRPITATTMRIRAQNFFDGVRHRNLHAGEPSESDWEPYSAQYRWEVFSFITELDSQGCLAPGGSSVPTSSVFAIVDASQEQHDEASDISSPDLDSQSSTPHAESSGSPLALTSADNGTSTSAPGAEATDMPNVPHQAEVPSATSRRSARLPEKRHRTEPSSGEGSQDTSREAIVRGKRRAT